MKRGNMSNFIDNETVKPYAEDIITFEELTCCNAHLLIEAGKKCPYLLTTYSPGCMIMWKETFNASFAFYKGCLIVKLNLKGKEHFLMPYKVEEDADLNDGLHAIERYVAKKGIPFILVAIQRSALPSVASRYTNFAVSSNRNRSDYIYLSADLQNFTGKKYSGQRNHINKFNKLFPQAVFRDFVGDEIDNAKLSVFWHRFEAKHLSDSKSQKDELANAKRLFSRPCVTTSRKSCIEIDGEIVAISYGEIFGDMLIVHIEKALDGYAGVYPFMVSSFAKAHGHGVTYINREDDAGVRGLRISKMQYQPTMIVENLVVHVNTGLNNVKEIPSITTERLVIDAITEGDIDDFNKLCLDGEHNKFWSASNQEDLNPTNREHFFKAVLKDFKNKVSLSLAIRNEGKFIGEVIINEFDYKGSANLSIRILPEYTSMGFGKEAFCAVSNFALYDLGLYSVTAYCYKENLPSFNLLTSCMTQIGEDDKYYYFKKEL